MGFEFIVALELNLSSSADMENIPSIDIAISSLSPSLKCEKISSKSSFLNFKQYKEVDEFLSNIEDTNLFEILQENVDCGFFIAIHGANIANQGQFAAEVIKARSLLSYLKQQDQTEKPRSKDVMITDEAYKTLQQKDQEKYRSAIEVEGIVAHRRFSDESLECFVISPIGEEDTPIRKRADHVFEKYIKPACESTDFKPIRGDMMKGDLITPDFKKELESAPLAIVYLGDPSLQEGWNPNVMYELGLRETTKRPLIVLKDATPKGSYPLPFDIKDLRIIDLPISEKNFTNEDYAVKVRTIREAIEIKNKESGWHDIYPAATYDYELTKKNMKITWASKNLEYLFEMKNLIGTPIEKVVEHLMQKMPAQQRSAFFNEQNELIGCLLSPMGGSILTLNEAAFDVGQAAYHTRIATVPIVFSKHQEYSGRAFLPIIASHAFNHQTSVLRMKVVYVEVTATLVRQEDGHWASKLVGDPLKEVA